MNPDRQCCSYIVPIPCRRLRTVVGTLVGVAATVLVADDASAADKPSLPPWTSAVSCVVDVSDWPLGVLPDDASAAFGPATLGACEEAVADWPLGVLPDDITSL